MSEQKIRYFSLSIISILVLYFYNIYFDFIYLFDVPSLKVQGRLPSSYLILSILIFTLFGLLIIISTFFKRFYHLLAALELLILTYAFIKEVQSIDVSFLFFALVVVIPNLFYYINLLINKIKLSMKNRFL